MAAVQLGRSDCPINLTVEVLGDKWSLIVLRDIMFANRRYFRELLDQSEEGIASNVLSTRLQQLTEHGLLTRAPDPSHRQKVLYSLTEPAIQLVPLLVQLGVWGSKHTSANPEISRKFVALNRSGPDAWNRLMDSLRSEHLS
ncbi:winged helix-turn-helix transcriptional regulator [Mycolicibacterium neoaurum]|uniref:winged helix-turn-helix transcriptional regulator n=1 Tax=Mycolicibacterium neoaurum TaxID=1795 RepID=UPI00088F0F71|nr:helix-turn-helix domain-containing protein [Mycolicibacterium neoaurum]SDC87667.1 DNA-binding transcriptional regulator, HxlR family [Mycolicibacterium neoaurum]